MRAIVPLRLAFWTGLIDYLNEKNVSFPLFEPRPVKSVRLNSGLWYVGFELNWMMRDNTFRIEIWFWREASIPIWEEFKTDPLKTDALIGEAWHFEKMSGQPRAFMFIERKVDDIQLREAWPELYQWGSEKLQLLYEQMKPHLMSKLKAKGISHGQSLHETPMV